MSFSEFRRQVEYKARMHEGQIVVVDRFFPIFPSSKISSCCGQKLGELPLSVREWTCPQCGARHDRDVNAAINLRKYAVSSTVSACGEESSGRRREMAVKLALVKQEANSKLAPDHI
jgi:putative transposase